MLTINEEVIITNGLLKDKSGIIKKLGNEEVMVEVSILGKKITEWFVNHHVIPKNKNNLMQWEPIGSDMIRKNVMGNTVAHIMWVELNENYIAYIYPKKKDEIPEYDTFTTFQTAQWWCDERLTALGFN